MSCAKCFFVSLFADTLSLSSFLALRSHKIDQHKRKENSMTMWTRESSQRLIARDSSSSVPLFPNHGLAAADKTADLENNFRQSKGEICKGCEI